MNYIVASANKQRWWVKLYAAFLGLSLAFYALSFIGIMYGSTACPENSTLLLVRGHMSVTLSEFPSEADCRAFYDQSADHEIEPGWYAGAMVRPLGGLVAEFAPWWPSANTFTARSKQSSYRSSVYNFPLWIPCALFSVLSGATYLPPRLRLRRRRRLGLCIHCGYDLRGSSERCPECGTPVNCGSDAARSPAGQAVNLSRSSGERQ